MKYTVIVQTVEYTAGIFRGKVTRHYIRCYNERDKLRHLKLPVVWGSPVKLISAEVYK